MKVAIHQPNFLPWCGWFAKLDACDVFILLDDAQMSKGSYVSRTRIRSKDGEHWLTVPTRVHDAPRIADVEIAAGNWTKKHLATLQQTYAKAPFVDQVMRILEPIYAAAGTNLSDFNRRLIGAVAAYLGIDKPMHLSSSFDVRAASDDRLIELIRKVGGTQYISGRGGSNYQDPAKFAAAGIELDVRVYSPVPYEGPRFPFMPGLSIVDALFVRGKGARELLRY